MRITFDFKPRTQEPYGLEITGFLLEATTEFDRSLLARMSFSPETLLHACSSSAPVKGLHYGEDSAWKLHPYGITQHSWGVEEMRVGVELG